MADPNVNGDQKPWETIGVAFATQYYNLFDTNRDQIVALYHPEAMITFENNQGQGHEKVKELLLNKFSGVKIQHLLTKIDCQPTQEAGILILVTGRLKTDNDPPHAFSETFYVRPVENSYFIFHDMFRLSIHDTM